MLKKIFSCSNCVLFKCSAKLIHKIVFLKLAARHTFLFYITAPSSWSICLSINTTTKACNKLWKCDLIIVCLRPYCKHYNMIYSVLGTPFGISILFPRIRPCIKSFCWTGCVSHGTRLYGMSPRLKTSQITTPNDHTSVFSENTCSLSASGAIQCRCRCR